MLGAILRLIAAGDARRRLGGYVQTAVTRYLVLVLAAAVFSAAAVFALLAGFWALNKWQQDPVLSAAFMAAILASIGSLIALIAFGVTREKNRPDARQALAVTAAPAPGELPTVEDIGRQIEHAVRKHGPVRVLAAAVAGGVIAGLLAKRLGRI
ncbi:MAG: hypothetical protein ACLPWS_20395 [Rhodomicrobium sp.]